MLVTDIDDTLIGDDEALDALRDALSGSLERVAFAIATGRPLPNAVRALHLLEDKGLPVPNVLITASGTMLSYGARKRERDRSWERQIDYRWVATADDKHQLPEFYRECRAAERPGLVLLAEGSG